MCAFCIVSLGAQTQPQGSNEIVQIKNCSAKSPYDLHINPSAHGPHPDTMQWKNDDPDAYTPEFIGPSGNPFTKKPGRIPGGQSSRKQILRQSTIDNCGNATGCDFTYRLKKDDGSYCKGAVPANATQFIMHVKG
jgi:hypothetical protein